jgi:hypothetical protein
MGRLTKAEIAFWDSIPDGAVQTCSDCGKQGPKAYVQPQYRNPGTALCSDCINRRNVAAAERRKAQLAAMDRCEVEGCRRRGNWKVGRPPVLLCGRHKAAAMRAYAKHAAGNPFGLFMPWQPSRAEVLELATERNTQ